MILRNLPAVFLLLALGLLAAAGYANFFLQDGPGAVVDNPDRTYSALPVGKKEVNFRLDNPTGHPVRVIGRQSYCGSNCTFSLKREIPFDIPAGATVDLECTLETRHPGEFVSQITLYLDDLGLRELPMTVQGKAE